MASIEEARAILGSLTFGEWTERWAAQKGRPCRHLRRELNRSVVVGERRLNR